MHMSNLPSYDDLEAKLLRKEISLSWNAEEKHSEALLVSRNNYYRGQPSCASQSSVFANNMMGGSSYTGQQHRPLNYARRYEQPSYQNAQNYQSHGGRHQNYQPRYRSREPENSRPEYCNFCFQGGHLDRECDLKAIVNRAKDIKFRFQDRRKRSM